VLGVASIVTRWCRGKPRIVRFHIAIDSRLSLGEQWEVLVHEYAHCLDRESRLRCRDRHDCRWGQHFSRAFRASINRD
jgi:hypothetical protein